MEKLLKFIPLNSLKLHVAKTIIKYLKSLDCMDLKKFKSNVIDPIKMLFDSFVLDKNLETVIENEIWRQKDKTNNNIIGYFHQNLFKHIRNKEWKVLKSGFDIVNLNKKIFVEIKNKHNTMNSSSSQKTFINMQNTIVKNPEAICMLVEIIAKKSQNIQWAITIDGKKITSEKIRRISIDRFYEIVTGDKFAFYKLCNLLPSIIKEVINNISPFKPHSKDIVLEELKKLTSKNLWDSLYKLSFSSYYGWNKEKKQKLS